jgi:hypothetical protein
LPFTGMSYTLWKPFPGYNPLNDSTHVNQKWYFSTYYGVSAGFGYFNGAGATVLSAPVGLQLNRPLNNNLIAFAGVSIAPAFFSPTHPLTYPAFNKYYSGGYLSNAYSFGMTSRAELGLMYVNDAKTFSISGSIGIEKSSYPVYPPNRMNSKKQ